MSYIGWFAIKPKQPTNKPGRVIPQTQKKLLDAVLLNNQYYRGRIKGKWSNPGNAVAVTLHIGEVAIEKEAFGLPSTKVANLTKLFILDRNNWYRKTLSKIYLFRKVYTKKNVNINV